MVYVPDWERLSDALTRIMATGLSKPEAQRDICLAIADHKFRVRWHAVKAEISSSGQSMPVVGSHVTIPGRLSPRDFDWRKSCPKAPWQHGDHPFVQLHFDLIELFSADVTLTLCGGRNRAQPSPETNSQLPPHQSREKVRPARGQAQAGFGEFGFDPNEWITLGATAEILRFEEESSQGSNQLRMAELLRREPSVARIVAATLPPLVCINAALRAGLIPLPDAPFGHKRTKWIGP